MARSKPRAGELAEASTSPVLTSTATSAEGTSPVEASALSAASCTPGERVVDTSLPGTASLANKGVSGAALDVTCTPAVPPRTASYCPWRPLTPAKSPAAYRPLDLATSSALTAPNEPSSGWPKVRVLAN